MVDEVVEIAVLCLAREVPVQESHLAVAVKDGVRVAEAARRPRVAVLDAEIRQHLLGEASLGKWYFFTSQYLSAMGILCSFLIPSKYFQIVHIQYGVSGCEKGVVKCFLRVS